MPPVCATVCCMQAKPAQTGGNVRGRMHLRVDAETLKLVKRTSTTSGIPLSVLARNALTAYCPRVLRAYARVRAGGIERA